MPPSAAADKPAEAPEACDDDMMARPSFRSTDTALAFIETSIAPIVPPNRYMRDSRQRHAGRESDEQQCRRQRRRQRARVSLRAMAGDEVAGQTMALTAPSAEQQDQQAKREFGDAEPGQEHGDLRRPAAEDEAVDEEDRGDRPAAATGASAVRKCPCQGPLELEVASDPDGFRGVSRFIPAR